MGLEAWGLGLGLGPRCVVVRSASFGGWAGYDGDGLERSQGLGALGCLQRLHPA